MATYNGLPLYKMTIENSDDVTGVEFISLVDYPAIEVNWVKFDANTKRYAFNSEKRMVTGPFLIPDLPIYRADASVGEYFVVFDKENIEKIVKKFNKLQKTLAINYQHEDNSQVADAIIVEQWMVGKTDKSKDLGFDLPEGTWIGTVFFEDQKFWDEQIKTEIVKGFSIEGFLNMEMNKIKNSKMKQTFKAEIKTVDGTTLYTSADAFAEGVDVYTIDGDGNEVLAADGDYSLENGTMLTVKDGKVVVVAEVQAQAETEATFEVTDADLAMILEALAPTFEAMDARIKMLEELSAELSKANTEMSTKLSLIPATGSKTQKADVKLEVTKMSLMDKIKLVQETQKKINNKK